MTANIPISLYIHFPWCIRKCPYCDFNSHPLSGTLPEKDYIEALLKDLENDLFMVQNRPLHSLFLGGGTPSLFSAESLFILLEQIKKHFNGLPSEITLEANPAAQENSQFKAFREIGINRLSLGAQSLQDKQLRALGRIHSAEDIHNAMSYAKKAGFKNINIDLMHGLPNQKVSEALLDLETALTLDPTHLSWYQLTLEPHTFFYTHPPRLPSESSLIAIQAEGHALLSQTQFKHYEISAYAKNEQRSEHNLNYWLFGDYLGIGAGAHSKWTDLKTGKIQRQWKIKSPGAYLRSAKMASSLVGGSLSVETKDLAFEFMMNTLRLNESIPLTLFRERTGLPTQGLNLPLEQAQQNGLLMVEDGKIKKTELGARFLNDLIQIFLT